MKILAKMSWGGCLGSESDSLRQDAINHKSKADVVDTADGAIYFMYNQDEEKPSYLELENIAMRHLVAYGCNVTFTILAECE